MMEMSDPSPEGGTAINMVPYGFSVKSSGGMFPMGVKSDKGTTDAFMAYALTTQCTDYMIAGWQWV